ncbi:MAG: DNA polymerase III subunit chi [Alphaproteobacteria bacterium]|nr:DNA polymerase III subunit chi [Alphaproteobacteria bacterium]
MTKVDFYHLQNQTLENVLPKLLEKSYQLGKKILVKIGNEERVDFINNLLWTYNEESFLPHGSKKDGHAEMQPIWLTSNNENPNNAEFLFLADGAIADCEEIAKFERVFNIFDGNSQTAVENARALWKTLKQQSFDISYWKRAANGTWEKQGE